MRHSLAIACLIGVPALAGCGGTETPAPGPTAETARRAPIDSATSAKLAEADAVDGETDRVLSRCLMCGLRMDGVAEHASTVGEYTVHHCGAGCKTAFDKDPGRWVALLEIPPANPG